MTSAANVTIRLLSDKDVEIWWPLRLQALKNEPESFGADYEEARLTPMGDVAKRLECTENAFVFGAFAPDLVGVAGFFRKQGKKSRHKGTVWGVYVDPAHRGRGISKELMKALIQHACRIEGLERVGLTVVTTNEAAVNLYRSLGFIEYGVERGALKLDGAYLDEVLMERPLSEIL